MQNGYLPPLLAMLAAVVQLGVATSSPAELLLPEHPAFFSAIQTPDTLRTARRQIAQKIEALNSAPVEAKENQQQRDSAIGLLRSIDVLYACFQTILEERRQLKDEETRTIHENESLADFGPAEAKPYSFLLFENLQAELASQKERETALSSRLKAAKKSLATGHEGLDQTKQTVWTSNPLLAEATDSWALSSEDLEEIRAKVAVALDQAEVENLELSLKNSQAREEFLKAKLKTIERDVKFTAQDRDKHLGILAAAEAKLRDQRRDAESALQEIGKQRSGQPGESTVQDATSKPRDPSTQELHRAAIAAQRQIVLLDQRIDALSTLRTMWKRRFQLASGEADPSRLTGWLADVDDFNKELKDLSQTNEYRESAPNAALFAAPPVAAGSGAEYDAAHALAERQTSALRALSAASLIEIKSIQQSLDRFHDELKAKIPQAKQNWLTAPLLKLWNFEIAGEDDEAVTLGTVVILLAYILAGVAIALLISRIVRGRLLARLGIHHGAADALKSILFYVLCIVFGFISFRVLNVPLAAFAFLGGAAAIAVGFGSQDIMNNFMSGIILLMEQPIRVGDVVDIGGVEGVVLHIGLRSTRLQTQTNHELIVPNKTLIDEQVTNLTLSNNLVKTSVAITLERSVKIEQAKHEILKLVFAHPMVIKSMRPLVLVKEVDNYWLVFEIHFWIQYTTFLESAAIQSDVLEAIGDHYRPLADDEKPLQVAAEVQPHDDESAEQDTSPADQAPPEESSRELSPSDRAATLATMQKLGNAAISKQLKRLGGLKIRG